MPPKRAREGTRLPDDETARRLHSAAIHLLRRLRPEDARMGLTGPRAAALSVLVFGGPMTLGALASAEQVRPPTMTRLVRALEAQGLVRRETDARDRRITRVRATARGRTLLLAGRERRVRRLAAALARLTGSDRRALVDALPVIEGLVREPTEPGSPAGRQSSSRKRSRSAGAGRGQAS